MNQIVQPDHSLPFDPDGPDYAEQAGRHAVAEMARRELIKKDFLEHCMAFHPDFKPGWVHRDLSIRLTQFYEDLKAGKRPRLMILFPPRHGKSATASILFSSWLLGLDPKLKIMNIGYNLDLPLEFSKEVREILKSKAYSEVFPETALRIDDRSAESWHTTKNGGFMAAGMQGGITGKGANVAIIDDPLKGQEEADSMTAREKLFMTYSAVVRTRLAPGGGILVIQTHWNDDDLAGRLQKQTEDVLNKKEGYEHIVPFEIVKFPAIAEKYEYRDNITHEILRFDEPIEPDEVDNLDYTHLRDEGEALHPERYNIEELLSLKAELPGRIFSALYQQNPIPEGGLFFTSKMIRMVPGLPDPEGGRVTTAWDLAIGRDSEHNYTVGATVQMHHSSTMYLRNIIRFKKQTHGIIEAMIEEARYYMDMDDPPDYRIAIEGGQIWKTMEHSFMNQWRQARLPTGMLRVMNPITDKQVRARPLQLRMEEGTFRVPQGHSWFPEWQHEVLRFPGGKDHDQIDGCAWAVRDLEEAGAPGKRKSNTVNDEFGNVLYRRRYKHQRTQDILRQATAGKRGGHMAA
jgi:phage terminase large subunit-like protein